MLAAVHGVFYLFSIGELNGACLNEPFLGLSLVAYKYGATPYQYEKVGPTDFITIRIQLTCPKLGLRTIRLCADSYPANPK